METEDWLKIKGRNVAHNKLRDMLAPIPSHPNRPACTLRPIRSVRSAPWHS